MKIKKPFLSALLAICCMAAWADGRSRTDTLTVEIYYKQGLYRLDPSYMDNQGRLDSLLGIFRRFSSDSLFHLNRFNIVSTASPEGGSSFNKALSGKRAKSIGRYLREHLSGDWTNVITERHIGVDWDNLRLKVERSDMPHKDEVLHVLKNTPELVIKDGVVVDSRKKQLMELRRGTCWRYLEKHFFAELRRSCVEMEYSVASPMPEQKEISATEDPVIITSLPADVPEAEEVDEAEGTQLRSRSPFCMAVKTNLLYDALLVPHVGVEFCLGKGFSVGGNWMYAWWSRNKRHRYWRIYGGELAVRKYFGRPEGGSPLTGHHLGIYGQVFTYDFETGGKGYMGGKPGGTLWDKMNYGAGLEYGYSLPVARRLNLDFVVGLGYWGGTYYEYLPLDDCYVWQRTKQRHWVGPTKVELSLVWLLGSENCNSKKKGGKR